MKSREFIADDKSNKWKSLNFSMGINILLPWSALARRIGVPRNRISYRISPPFTVCTSNSSIRLKFSKNCCTVPYALTESMPCDEDGWPVSTRIKDCGILSAQDTPEIEVIGVEGADPLASFLFNRKSAPDRWQTRTTGPAALPGHSSPTALYYGSTLFIDSYADNTFGQIRTPTKRARFSTTA